MFIMTNLSETVRGVVDKDGAIKSDLARGLINIRALSRFIQRRIRDESGKEMSLDAVISAVRRYPIEDGRKNHQNIGGLLQKITMRNKIIDVAMRNDPEIPLTLGKIASQIDYGRGETFRVVAGVESIRVIIDEKNADKLSIIPKEKIITVVTNLVEIIVSLQKVAERTPGIVSTVTSELAIDGINMIEFMSCVPELIMVVEDKDALKSYELLEKLARGGV